MVHPFEMELTATDIVILTDLIYESLPELCLYVIDNYNSSGQSVFNRIARHHGGRMQLQPVHDSGAMELRGSHRDV